MPLFLRGVQKPPSTRSYYFKNPTTHLNRPVITSGYSYPPVFSSVFTYAPAAPSPFIAPSPFVAPSPVSSVFDSQDCIWYYGTVYVRESVAVSKVMELQHHEKPEEESEKQNQEPVTQTQDQEPAKESEKQDDDDDSESVSSGNSSNNPRNIGKQNQLKYLKDGMRLRHCMTSGQHEWDHWYATYDAETNRVIRTPDGVAFDTLRQFSRLHCNEVLGTTATLTNVWSDPHFQYKDMDSDSWHPLSKLKH